MQFSWFVCFVLVFLPYGTFGLTFGVSFVLLCFVEGRRKGKRENMKLNAYGDGEEDLREVKRKNMIKIYCIIFLIKKLHVGMHTFTHMCGELKVKDRCLPQLHSIFHTEPEFFIEPGAH